jgi:hypothetical protein
MMVGTSGSPLGMILSIVNLYVPWKAPHTHPAVQNGPEQLSAGCTVASKLPSGLHWSAALATPTQQTARATRIAGLNAVINFPQTSERHAYDLSIDGGESVATNCFD